MANETQPKTIDDLYQQIAKQSKQTLRYTRMRLLGTWLVIALLAILTALTLIATSRNAQTDLAQTNEIATLASTNAHAATQDANQATSDTDEITAYLRGEQGIPGVPGANGQDGTPGQPSSEPGPRGPQGANGDPGPMGPLGPAGTTGLMGTAGATGNDGSPGTPGTPGHIGEQGLPGPKGDTGAEGPVGPTGPRGDTGPTGPAGPAGTTTPPTTSIALGQSANDATAHKVVNATCTSGRASGGGFAIIPSDPGIIPTASTPLGNTGWSATVDVLSLPAGTTWQLLVFVVCIS